MIIRRAKGGDIDQITQLFDDLELANLVFNLSETTKKFVRRKENAGEIIKTGLERALNKETNLFLIAELDNKIVGYLKGEIEKRSATKLYDKKLYIRHLIVSKQYRNMGIGSKLVQEAEAFAKSQKIPFVTLKTSPKNILANQFYKNLGFEGIYMEMIKEID
ncbi:MAG: GNAT family N-acetyltransferase [Candidatus Aenigmarchaeota archaeon]|nr:GNAT family N-acetyltransferase [Candidatus Aenigmarchaeota archaeon]